MFEEKKTNYWMIVAITQWIIICLMMTLMYPTMEYIREQLNDMRSYVAASHKEIESRQEEMRQFMNDNKDWQTSIERKLKDGLEKGEW